MHAILLVGATNVEDSYTSIPPTPARYSRS